MRLTDLQPRWYVLHKGGQRVGFTFDCPHCLRRRIGVAVHNDGHRVITEQEEGAHPPGYVWQITSGSDFHNISLTPSVDGSSFGCWHGHITDGEIVGGSLVDFERLMLHSLHSLHEKVVLMSKTVADVEAAIADLKASAQTTATDVTAKLTSLEAQITALQGQTSPDFTQVLSDLADVKTIVAGTDPGAPAAPSA